MLFVEQTVKDSAAKKKKKIYILGAKILLEKLGHLHLSEKSRFSVVYPFDPGSMREAQVFLQKHHS